MTGTRNKDVMKQPVFDYDDFLERIDGDVELMNEVIEIFLNDTPSILTALYTAIEQHNWHDVERAAHTLKGAAANISARRLQKLSQYVQRLLKNNEDPRLESFIDEFQKSFDELDHVLRGYLDTK